MGITISAINSKYDFDMGYGGFFNLRRNIALCLNQEFGENYSELGRCYTEEQFKQNDRIAEYLINKNSLDKDYKDVLDFLYSPDSSGKITYRTCKKISNLLSTKDLSKKCFRYAAYTYNDYQEFIEFLNECYSKRRNMYWY